MVTYKSKDFDDDPVHKWLDEVLKNELDDGMEELHFMSHVVDREPMCDNMKHLDVLCRHSHLPNVMNTWYLQLRNKSYP